jgi:hydrogenase expression/formation protein HypE
VTEGDGTFEACPLPASRYDRVVLAHGGGGRLTDDLVRQVFLPALGGPLLGALEDQATLPLVVASGGRVAVTTDAFVVKPIFFPGGDIGSLAVHGTVNDLAVGGATPLYLTAAFVLEEGLPIADLERVVRSMRRACDESSVELVAGDTKVVDRGKGDQIFIATTGVGVVPAGLHLSISQARAGDRVLVSGTIGDHGIAILSVRDGLEFETRLESDAAPVVSLARAVLAASPRVRCMRDPTRGGLAATAHEIAAASKVGVILDEAAIPQSPAVRAACGLLGLDPLHVANEGKLVAVVPAEDAAAVLAAMRADPRGRDAAIIGEIVEDPAARVALRTPLGGARIVPAPVGEPLPRIC